MTYKEAIEIRDLRRIDRLNKLTNKQTFWKDVRKITSGVHDDHPLGRWQTLAEIRYEELV